VTGEPVSPTHHLVPPSCRFYPLLARGKLRLPKRGAGYRAPMSDDKREPDEPDPVTEAGEESFPTSDAPSWTLGRETIEDQAQDENGGDEGDEEE